MSYTHLKGSETFLGISLNRQQGRSTRPRSPELPRKRSKDTLIPSYFSKGVEENLSYMFRESIPACPGELAVQKTGGLPARANYNSHSNSMTCGTETVLVRISHDSGSGGARALSHQTWLRKRKWTQWGANCGGWHKTKSKKRGHFSGKGGKDEADFY